MGRQVKLESLPGSEAVPVHWFERTNDGPIKTPRSEVVKSGVIMRFGGVTGRIACQPKATSVLPRLVGGVHWVVIRSDDIRAVTCKKCLATATAQQALAEIAAASVTAASEASQGEQ